MSDTTLYYAAQSSEHPVGANRVLICTAGVPQVIDVDPSTLGLLHLCQGARKLDDHARHIARVTSRPETAVRSALDTMVDSGLLRPVVALRAVADVALPSPPPIDRVGIVTADRPETVARGLAEALAHVSRYERAVRFLVVDGSKDPRCQSATRDAVERLGARPFVTYIGPSDARSFVSRLTARGFDAARLLSALTAGTAGANRNLLILLTTGRSLLMVDDDVRWRVWRPPGQDQRLAVGGHADLRRSTFFLTRAEAVDGIPDAAVDLLAVHETLLGHDIRTLIDQEPDLANTCDHVLHTLAMSGALVVRVTLAGIAGDSGTYCPYNLLFTQGSTWDELTRDRSSFARAWSSRETRRVTTRPVVTHSPQCMAYCMGVANTSVVPPFMPMGRNQDGVFGTMLAFVDPGVLFGHVPWGIVHDSDRPSAWTDGPIASATQTRLADVVLAVLRFATGSVVSRTPAQRYRRLASVFSELGDLPPGDFLDFLIQILTDARSRLLNQLELALLKDPSSPDYWRAAARTFREQFMASVRRPEFFCPIEFRSPDSLDEGLRATQVFLRDFGELLAIWPDVWKQACREAFS